MRFSMPKPLDGWRAFIGEVGTIVLAVLLALGAQQLAESANNRREAAETRALLFEEIEESLGFVQLRGTSEACVDQRLKEVRALLDEWARTGNFKTPLWVAQAPRSDVIVSRYDAAASAGRLALLNPEEQLRIGLIVNRLRGFNALQARETEVWATLRMLQSGSDVLSETDRSTLRLALQEASVLHYRAKLAARQVLPLAERYGWHPNMTGVRQAAGISWIGQRYRPSICVPIDTPPDEAHRLTGLVVPLPE
jgi:hypothetical protein